jgi:hypothetical protein
MNQNMRLGQYKSLNALAKVFELRDQNRYLFFLEKFKPFCLDKQLPRLVEDEKEHKTDAKTLYWIVREIKEKAEKCAAKNILKSCEEMEKKADEKKVDEFWDLFPELKERIDLFMIDYYQIFPHLKPADKTDQDNTLNPDVSFKPHFLETR